MSIISSEICFCRGLHNGRKRTKITAQEATFFVEYLREYFNLIKTKMNNKTRFGGLNGWFYLNGHVSQQIKIYILIWIVGGGILLKNELYYFHYELWYMISI